MLGGRRRVRELKGEVLFRNEQLAAVVTEIADGNGDRFAIGEGNLNGTVGQLSCVQVAGAQE